MRAMDSDPRVSKPRLPKPYTEEQLSFLRSHISGFETRTRGHVRGDAKKFALDRANDFLLRFGLPLDLQGVEEAEPRFREQIYNWYKNTVGRARRKLGGRTRPKKSSDKASPANSHNTITWSPNLATPTTVPYATPIETQSAEASSSTQPIPPTQASSQLQFTFQSSVSVPITVPSASAIAHKVTPTTLREAFLAHSMNPATLSSFIESYVLSHPSPTPLTTIVHALFNAVTSLSTPANSPTASNTDTIFSILQRFIAACQYFPPTLVHADVSGPLAGQRALQIALRKSSVWSPLSASSGHTSIADEMERIAADRQRRKDHVQWAHIHAAALELRMLSSGYHHRTAASDMGYGVPPPSGQTFSEMMVRDAVWESDEVEWVAGIIVLRAIIRTGCIARKAEYELLLGTYERRWKEIKDEARQALVTEVLLGARDDLVRLDETRAT
ncbi:hypothetical protein PAXRUDRAFT_515852 [Paxillus rubicundulus Ve08.2h10]|uniref:Uncharacterized protein n=1 Tax=Paxillus rubicundulus Ve08.2h10 TaxID=930991 RepID=A0A0D0D8X4_9AGAM|nr:hypothetical protein PAXRUDRAFT_515852 [Paxillus rubicundulus Ve08.2h10]